jgi:hypothetical protein
MANRTESFKANPDFVPEDVLMLVIGCSNYAQVSTRVPWPDLTATGSSVAALNEFADRFNPKYRFTHMNPSEVELNSVLNEIEATIKHARLAVFIFIIGYFKAPTSLLLTFKDHNTGHYASFDLRRFSTWSGIFLQVVLD